jgi:hypothetical protein
MFKIPKSKQGRAATGVLSGIGILPMFHGLKARAARRRVCRAGDSVLVIDALNLGFVSD